MRRADDNGSTSTFGLLGALILLVSTFSFAAFVQMSPSTTSIEDRTLEHEAQFALYTLVKPPPRALDGTWTAETDALSNLGRAGATASLDREALDLFARGSLLSSPNGAPDYPDVKEALGIADDFHLRSSQLVPPRDAADWEPLPLRVAYFGHYSGARAPMSAATSVTTSTQGVDVNVVVTNRASFPALATANVALGDIANGRILVSQDRHTTLLAPGESQTQWVRFPPLDWSSKANAVRVTLTDAYGNPATDAAGATIASPWMALTPPRTPQADAALLLQAANPYYVAGADVTFDLGASGGTGAGLAAQTRIALVGPEGREWANESVSIPAPQGLTWTCANCTRVGNYTAKLVDDSGRLLATDRVHVSAALMFTEKQTPDALATTEIGILDSLLSSFDPSRFSTTSAAGDVFGDDVNGPTELPTVLDRYDAVVIGSEASHHALSPADVKHAITSWLDQGGTLIVLGTSQEPSRWLQSEYGLGLGQAPGVVAAPDATHPLLVEPETLDHTRYTYGGRAWVVPPGGGFEHVLALGNAPDGSAKDALAISAPGELGEGTLILTSYLPGALTTPQDADAATALLHNLLVHASGRLSFDFGPPIPQDVPVSAATRVLPAIDQEGRVTVVKLTLHVFPG